MDEKAALLLVADGQAPVEARAATARELRMATSDAALAGLIAVASDQSTPEPVARAAGAAVGEIVVRTGRRLHDYDLYLSNFTEAAFLAFDEAVGTLHELGYPLRFA